jgi:hypothetical protein
MALNPAHMVKVSNLTGHGQAFAADTMYYQAFGSSKNSAAVEALWTPKKPGDPAYLILITAELSKCGLSEQRIKDIKALLK